jgi:peroxiredoxin
MLLRTRLGQDILRLKAIGRSNDSYAFAPLWHSWIMSMPNLDDLKQGNGHLERSRLKRNGLTAGVRAPSFRLPRLDGGELALEDCRGKQVLLVLSDPGCGPCNQLAPWLEEFHRRSADIQVLMIGRGDPDANRAKVAEHGLTFPVMLQQRWEVSREYAMFATPTAYLIDEQGMIAANVALGVEAIMALATGTGRTMHEQVQARLEVLRREFETGQVELAKVERQGTYLRETMLRISGAIQVLEELLASGKATGHNGPRPEAARPAIARPDPSVASPTEA